MLAKKLMTKGKTKEASDALCFKLVTILLYGDLPFVLSGAPVASTMLVVYGPKLRRHLGGRVRHSELQSAFSKLLRWGVLRSMTEGFDTFMLDFGYPRGFKPDNAEIGRVPVSLPAIHDAFDPPKKKAKLIEESVKRKLKGRPE